MIRYSIGNRTSWAQIYWAWKATSVADKAALVMEALQRRKAYRSMGLAKPVVVVIRAQGKRLLVLRVGAYFVSAFTWDRLQYKVVYGGWKRVDQTTLKYRIP